MPVKFLKNTFRSSDIVARFGGDEFIILAIEPYENSGETMLARLQERINATNTQNNRPYKLTFSIGLARHYWKEPRSIESLLEEADREMYTNKHVKRSQSEPQI